MPTEAELRLDALTETQDAEVLAAETAAAAAATQRTKAEVVALTAAAVITYEAADSDDERSALVAALRQRLAGMEVSVKRVLIEHFLRAVGLGQRQAYQHLGERVPVNLRRDNYVPSLLPEVVTAAEDAEEKARSVLVDAGRRLAVVEDVRDLEDGLARARQSLTPIERAATWGVNRSVAAGVTEVAQRERTGRLWVGERDACLHCLAYFGEVAGPFDVFPSGLTFGRKPLSGPVPDPPLHPHCRCRIVLWRGEWEGAQGGYPEALKREARRSVARGWSLESESERSRLDAAERLLRAGARLPKTVEQYAARAVARGEFPRGRRFPG